MDLSSQSLLKRQLPVGLVDFDDVIDEKMIYVDKTDLVADIAAQKGIFFLSRPRRFGKTLLVSTFHELFARGVERFKGLKLERLHLWNDHTYSVIRLSLNDIAECTSQGFEQSFVERLTGALAAAGITFAQGSLSWAEALRRILQPLENKSLVLLIDEYDAPLTHVLDDPEEFARRLTVLNQFFTILKNNFGKFRFIFITGVTRFSNLSPFSSFNNLRDLSFTPTYSALTGITQEELETYFAEYIEQAARVFDHKYPGEGWDRQKLLAELQYHYGGWSFDTAAQTRVYNPWAVLNFFADPNAGFVPYWAATGGTLPPLLTAFLRSLIERDGGVHGLSEFLRDDFVIPVRKAQLTASVCTPAAADFPFTALLYQAGYFTIKSTEDDVFIIGVPNREVRRVFNDCVFDLLTPARGKTGPAG